MLRYCIYLLISQILSSFYAFHDYNLKNTLKGKIIAVNTFKNIEELMVRKYLNSIGITWADVEKVEVPFPRMLPLIEAEEVNVISIVEPFITIAKNDNSTKWLCNHYLTTTQKTLVATYVSSEQIVNDKKKIIEKFVSAMNNATEFINKNEGKSREIISRYTKIPPELLSEIGLSEFATNIELSQLDMVIKDMQAFEYLSNFSIPTSKELVWKSE